MTLHYHGTPLSIEIIKSLTGRCFCVSHAAPGEIKHCLQYGQSVMLDNGAFSKWKSKKQPDWNTYYQWVEEWSGSPTTWAIIPDEIDAGAKAQDELIKQWPFGYKGAPVWHLDEPLTRLERLVDNWPRVCIGSTSEYAVVLSRRWQTRMDDAFNRICKDQTIPWIHMLRGMQCSGLRWPFASVDSTAIALNHWRKGESRSPLEMAQYWDSKQCPSKWDPKLPEYGFIDKARIIEGEW